MTKKKPAKGKADEGRRSKADWDELVALFEESGLRQVDFCAEMGLNPKQFSYQRSKRLGATPSEPVGEIRWMEAAALPEHHGRPEPPAARNAPAVTVRVGEYEVDVRPGFDAGLLRDVCEALSCRA